MEKSRRHFTKNERWVLEDGLKTQRIMEETVSGHCKHRTSVFRELRRNRGRVGVGVDKQECPKLYVCNSCNQYNFHSNSFVKLNARHLILNVHLFPKCLIEHRLLSNGRNSKIGCHIAESG